MNKDAVVPKDRWEFDAEVTKVFDDMLQRSIPEYTTMRDLVFKLACRYQQRNTDIVDLGCSRGEALAPLIDRFGAYNRYVGIDISQSMLEASRQRFKGYIDTGVVSIRNIDLRHEYPPVSASVTLGILTIQFTPIEYRLQIIERVYDHTVDGGVFIFVEKVLGANAKTDALLNAHYYEMKGENGYSQEQIECKKLALEGVLVPVTAKWNEDMLATAGFKHIDCFWKCLNFAGWIAVK